MTEDTRLEPTLLSALLRFWKTALAVAVLVTLAATLAAAATTSREHFAESSMVLADPRDDLLFETGDQVRQADYVADQVDILQSAEIARRASEQAIGQDPSFPYGTLDMIDRIDISRGEGAALVRIRFEAEQQDWAVIGANAVTAAYREFLATQNEDRFDASIQVLEAELANLDDQIVATRDAIRAQAATDESQAGAVLGEVATQLGRLVELQSRLAGTNDPDTQDALRAQIDDIRVFIESASRGLELEGTSPTLTVLQGELDQLIQRSGSLEERRQNLAVDRELIEGGVRFDTPAIVAESSGAGDLRTIVASGFLGLVAGVAVAYALGLRNRRFKTASEAGLVTAAPVIASFPATAEEAMVGVVRSGRIPGTDRSTFFAPALETLMGWAKEQADDRGLVVGFTSPTHGGGTSSIVGSLARASVDSGYRTLVVDGDLGVRDLTRMVAPDALGRPGLVEAVAGETPPEEIVLPVSWAGGTFDLVSRGASPDVEADFFQKPQLLQLLVELAVGYDLVLMDMPPVFGPNEAGAVAGASDRVVAIVSHGLQLADVERMRDDFAAADGIIDGVIYNREPDSRSGSSSLNALRPS